MLKNRTFKIGRIAVFAFAVIILFTCLTLLPYNKAYADTSPITSSTVPDGVYAIRNASTGRYLGVNSYETGTYLRAYSLTAEPSGADNRAYMFKIEAVGSSGNYVIRTMSNNYNSFAPVSSSSNSMLRAVEISTTNSSVPSANLFTIAKSTNGYTIKKNGGAYFMSQQTETGNAVVMLNSTSLYEWEFIPMSSSYYSVDYYGGSASVDHDIAVGEIETVRAYFYSTNLSHSSVVMSLRSEDSALATSETNTTNSMTVTPNDIGLIRHRASIMTKTGGTAVTYSLDFVNIHFADGVYSLKNSYSGKYMKSDWDIGNRQVGKATYNSIPQSEAQRKGLFKFEYTESSNNITSGGTYVIRSMFANKIVVYPSTSDVRTYVHDSNDNSTIASSYRWTITRDSNGFYQLVQITTSDDPLVASSKEYTVSRIAYQEGTVGIEDDGYWHMEAASTSGERSKWTITKYTGSTFVTAVLTPAMNYVVDNSLPSTLDVSEASETVYFYSTNPGQNKPTLIGYELCDANGDSLDSLITGRGLSISSSGVLTVPDGFVGMIGVKAIYDVSYGNTSSICYSEHVRVYIKPADDSYLFIANLHSFEQPQYLTAAKTTSGYVAKYEEFAYLPNQIWRKEAWNDSEYVKLVNVATGLCLVSPESVTYGASILLKEESTISNTDCAKWKCIVSGDGSGKNTIIWKSKYMENNTQFVLATSGTYAIQSNSSRVIYHANIGLGGDVVIFGADTWDVPSSQDLVAMRIAVNLAVEPNGRYNSFSIHTFVNSNSAVPVGLMDNAKIYIHLAHGQPTYQQTNKNSNGLLTIYNLSSLDLSNLDLVIFTGCETAKTLTSGYNLPEKTKSLNASVSVGFATSVNDIVRDDYQRYDSYFGDFYRLLFENLYLGESIIDIKDRAISLFNYGFESMQIFELSGENFRLVNNTQ